MKSILFSVLIVVLVPVLSMAQCVVDAGEDQTVCRLTDDSVRLNGSVLEGVSPYKVAWSTVWKYSSLTYHASIFLDDTTSLTPILPGNSVDSLTFFLDVEDSMGFHCRDSMTMLTSDFSCFTIVPEAHINKGDTIGIGNLCFSNQLPMTFRWWPNNNISDTTVSAPLVWPEETMEYHVEVVDRLGCGEGFPDKWTIYVTPTALEENALSHLVNVHPNPVQADGMLRVGTDHHFMGMQVLDAQGRMVWERDGFVKELDMSTFQTGQGVHFLVLTDRDGQNAVKRFVVE